MRCGHCCHLGTEATTAGTHFRLMAIQTNRLMTENLDILDLYHNNHSSRLF